MAAAPTLGSDLRLLPAPDSPGLYIYAPVTFEMDAELRWPRFFGRLAARPRAVYACRCGYTRRGIGHQAVADVIAAADHHRTTCTPRETAQHRAA